MYQVTFSDQSAQTLQLFSKERQLKLIQALSVLSPAVLEEAKEPLVAFHRAETLYYRYRVEDLRFYFTLKDETIHCVYILNKNTWADFRLRANLEKLSDAEIEQKPNFFSLLEEKK